MRARLVAALALLCLASGCVSKTPDKKPGGTVMGAGASGGSGGTGTMPGGGSAGIHFELPDGSAASGGTGTSEGGTRDPNSCDEAVKFRTYLGCEYFPTVLGNVVSPTFDFAVVVANAGTTPADVTVTGPNAFTAAATVAAQGLSVIALPWVADLKGPAVTASCNSSAPFTTSILSRGGAYHLTASHPVAAYQFNPLEFSAKGGPPGKDWSNCVLGSTSTLCECNSYSNDASLLLPVNALSSNYTAFTWRDEGMSKPVYIAVTAVSDQTEVAVKLGPNAATLAGPAGSGLSAQTANAVFTVNLDAGDVLELQAVAGSDLSGTQVQSTSDTKPIQVMTGSPSANAPHDNVRSGDHIEEIVPPAESLGHDYVVTVPTGPYGKPVEHVVRLYGHATATNLSYFPATPAGAPSTLMPYTVAEFAVTSDFGDFQVQGTEPFAVGSFLVGGQLLDPTAPPTNSAGDPSESFTTALPQYRDSYVFLAPIDYENNFVDVVAPAGTTLTLDGTAVDATTAQQLAGRSPDGVNPLGFDIYRILLDAGPSQVGAHVLTASAPVGIQVVGYGRFTSYQYPGGLNLNLIADPPPPIIPK
ncbi:MAG TPA: IgGFc-binding protein [Polyangiaceae bacterium]|jgi:hypothetical protein